MLAGAVGVMNGSIFQVVDPHIGFQVGLTASTAAVVVGIGSLRLRRWGSRSGSGVLARSETFVLYQDAIVFAILIAFPLLRSFGIFGFWPRRRSDVTDGADRADSAAGRPAHRRRRVGRLDGAALWSVSGIHRRCARSDERIPGRSNFACGRRRAPGSTSPAEFNQTPRPARRGRVALVFALLALGVYVVTGFAAPLDLGDIADHALACTVTRSSPGQVRNLLQCLVDDPDRRRLSALLGVMLGLPSRAPGRR